MKNTGIYKYVYDFSGDYDVSEADDILDILKQHGGSLARLATVSDRIKCITK